MTVLALLLAVLGTGIVSTVAVQLWEGRRLLPGFEREGNSFSNERDAMSLSNADYPAPPEFESFNLKLSNVDCLMPAPMGDRLCLDEAGHQGWHHTVERRWFGSAWGPPATAPTVVVEPAPAPSSHDADISNLVSAAIPRAAKGRISDTTPAREPGPGLPQIPLPRRFQTPTPEPARLGGPPLRFKVGAFGIRKPIPHDAN